MLILFLKLNNDLISKYLNFINAAGNNFMPRSQDKGRNIIYILKKLKTRVKAI